MTFNLENESYDITPELIVSDIINRYSSNFYTKKNTENIYDYDLKCFSVESSIFIGFIEVEHCNHERMDGPKWEHSFLARKILEWDKDNQRFKDDFKKHSENTIYIKFNRNYDLDDCICCSISMIKRFQKKIRHETGNVYNDTVFRTCKYDKRVPVGVHDCIKYIEDYFLHNSRLDKWM